MKGFVPIELHVGWDLRVGLSLVTIANAIYITCGDHYRSSANLSTQRIRTLAYMDPTLITYYVTPIKVDIHAYSYIPNRTKIANSSKILAPPKGTFSFYKKGALVQNCPIDLSASLMRNPPLIFGYHCVHILS